MKKTKKLSVHAKNKKIVDDFYAEYYRPPKSNEFIDLGGDIEVIRSRYGHGAHRNNAIAPGYWKWLNSIGYPRVGSRSESYEVYRPDNGEVIFTGTSKDISEEFDIAHTTTVLEAARKGWFFRTDYKIRLKPYVFKNKELER